MTSVGALLTGDLLFTDATYDVGKTGATRPRDLFVSRNVEIGGTTTMSGNLLFNATDTYDIGVANVAATLGVTSPKNMYLTGVLVVGTRAQIPSPLPALHVVQPNNAQVLRYDTYVDIAPFGQFRANGTPFAPTKSLSGNVLGGVASFNHTGAAFGSGPSARILMIAIEDGDVGRGAYMQFGTAPSAGSVTARWRINQNGHFLAEVDNTYDFGASGATRPRDLFLGRNLAVGGTLVVTGNVVGDLLFTDATYDIGKSGATRPRDGFFSRNVTVGGLLTAAGGITVSGGTMAAAGQVVKDASLGLRISAITGSAMDFELEGPAFAAILSVPTGTVDLVTYGHLYQNSDNTKDLGVSATQNRFRNGFFGGSLNTGAPAGGTAKPWKFGQAASISPTSPNRTIELDVNGTLYYVHAKTTND